MKLLIAGSRHLCPSIEEIDHAVDTWRKIMAECGLPWWREIDTVVSGGARGVDAHGEQWARHHGHKVERHDAEWKRLGKKAGFVRNEAMAQSCALGLIFWDGHSTGTKHMLDLLTKYRRPSKLIYRAPDIITPPPPRIGL